MTRSFAIRRLSGAVAVLALAGMGAACTSMTGAPPRHRVSSTLEGAGPSTTSSTPSPPPSTTAPPSTTTTTTKPSGNCIPQGGGGDGDGDNFGGGSDGDGCT